MTTLAKILGVISLFHKAFSRHTKKIVSMITLGFLGGFFGGIGIGAMIPLFYIITNKSGVGTDSMTQLISKIFGYLHIPLTLPAIIMLMGFLFVFKAIFLYFANHLSSRVYTDYELETRERLFRKTLKTDWPYLMHQKTGHLNDILMGDVGGISGALNNISAAILTSTS